MTLLEVNVVLMSVEESELLHGLTLSTHMDSHATRLAFLREAVKEEKCQLHHVQTQGMVADIFTKPLPATQFHYLRRLILI